MTRITAALLAGVAIAIGGCASQKDILAPSKAGYIADTAAIVAATDWSQPEVVRVALSEYEFSPAALTFRRNQPYRLVLSNTGGATHYFVSEGFYRAIAARTLVAGSGEIEMPLLQSVAVPPGTEKEILFVPVKAGTYKLECTAPFHASFGMVGTLRIQ